MPGVLNRHNKPIFDYSGKHGFDGHYWGLEWTDPLTGDIWIPHCYNGGLVREWHLLHKRRPRY
jgi:hypothetical protein